MKKEPEKKPQYHANKGSTLLSKELIEILLLLRQAVGPIGHLRPLSLDEAAKALRCRRSDVEALIYNGVLPVIKRNGRRYLLPGDIQKRLREEIEYERANRDKKHGHKPKHSLVNPKDIDPALKEFFEE